MGSNPPSFFKFLTHENLTRLHVPHKYPGAFPTNVILRDRYVNLWRVKPEKVRGKWFFQDGWVRFVEENSLELGDLIEFKYFNEGIYDVKFFGASGIGKKGVGHNMNTFKYEKIKDEEEHGDEDEEEDKDKDEDEDEYRNEDYDGDEYMEEDEDCDADNEKEDIEQVTHDDIGDSTKFPKFNRKGRCYGADIFKAGLTPLPSNPYFVTKINPNRRNELFLPMDFLNDHKYLDLPEEMVIIDPYYREYRLRYVKWSDGRILYRGSGWSILHKLNGVNKDDISICEFVQKPGSEDLHMKISFVHAKRG